MEGGSNPLWTFFLAPPRCRFSLLHFARLSLDQIPFLLTLPPPPPPPPIITAASAIHHHAPPHLSSSLSAYPTLFLSRFLSSLSTSRPFTHKFLTLRSPTSPRPDRPLSSGFPFSPPSSVRFCDRAASRWPRYCLSHLHRHSCQFSPQKKGFTGETLSTWSLNFDFSLGSAPHPSSPRLIPTSLRRFPISEI